MTCPNCEQLQQRIKQLEALYLPATVREEEETKFIKTVIVKFRDGHKETHLYKDTVENTNESVIASVKRMFPSGTVVNVMIVEKG